MNAREKKRFQVHNFLITAGKFELSRDNVCTSNSCPKTELYFSILIRHQNGAFRDKSQTFKPVWIRGTSRKGQILVPATRLSGKND